jgi:hypothetical protein
MDFSGAQRGAHAEAYADAIISTIPHFSQLSQAAQDAERKQLVLEAEKGELGCQVHFWRSADQVRKTHSLIPPESATIFEKILRELVSPVTTSERFDEALLLLKTTFPAIKHWISWWERRPIASMIFPAKSSVDPDLAAKAPSTTNPIEHQHSLLHHAVGKDQDLVPGIEKLYLHMREMENKYNAIKGMSLNKSTTNIGRCLNFITEGHFNAGAVRNRRPPKPPVYELNDGRPPDTIAALAVAEMELGSPVMSPFPPATPFVYSPRMLQSFKWASPNSCFFDTPLELWFRAFALWPGPERVDFLKYLPSSSALAKFFYIFQRRLLWIESNSPDLVGDYDFSLCQSHARALIFDRWKLYASRDMYGNATSWLLHAIQVSLSVFTLYSPHQFLPKDSGTSLNVQLNFRLEHLLSGMCPAGHQSLVSLHGIPLVLPLNHFDLRVARAKFGPTTSLTEYFSTAMPRIFTGTNMIGGSALVHSLPARRCTHNECLAQFQSHNIETRWPRILHINPDTGSQPALPMTRAFTVSDGTGNSVGYRLVGTMSFDSDRQHYTAKIMIDDQSFRYDGMYRGGALVPLGSLDMMCVPDSSAVMWVYHRTSSIDAVRLRLTLLSTFMC